MQLRKHLKTINHHKAEVMKNCFRTKLYRQGLLHDLSKYSPTELIPGGRYYQGDRSPNAKERELKGYSAAWLHHKGKNKHHWEYWIDFSPAKQEFAGCEMPLPYVLEMVCDRIAASKTYRGEQYTDRDPLAYYERSRYYYIIHPKTDALLKELLTLLAEQGEEALFAGMRRLLGEERRKNLQKHAPKMIGACYKTLWEKKGLHQATEATEDMR